MCQSNCESLRHLFFDCPFAAALWAWLFSLFRVHFPHDSSLPDLFLVTQLPTLNPSSRSLWFIAVCNLLWCLWTERNKRRYDGGGCCAIRLKQFYVLSLQESASLVFSPSTPSACSLPIFGLLGLSPLRLAAPKFIPVCWVPPSPNWVKVNTDGSYREPNVAGFGGIFLCNAVSFMGAFSCKVNVASAVEAELLAMIEAVSLAWLKGWQHLWLETDSLLVLHYFKSPTMVPWRLRIPWVNCLHVTKQMHFHISHTFREGNLVVDILANYGAAHPGSQWWDVLPQFLVYSILWA